MNTQFNYSPSGDTLIITIANPMPKRSRYIYYINALLFFATGIFFFYILTEKDFSGYLTMFASGILLICAYIGRAMLRKPTQYEILTVTKTTLTLQLKGFMQNRQRVMPIERIHHIFVADAPQATPSGARFDNSFLPGQREVELLADLDKEYISLNYDGRQIQFGKGIGDADAEYLIKRIREFTGKEFSGISDPFEQYISDASQN